MKIMIIWELSNKTTLKQNYHVNRDIKLWSKFPMDIKLIENNIKFKIMLRLRNL